MKLNIAISARGLNAPFSGPRSYIEGFSRAFIDAARHHNIYIYYNTPDLLGKYPDAQERVLPEIHNLFWDHLLLPRALKKDKIDVAIFPKGTIPLIRPCKSIAIMLDLGYFYPELNAYKVLDTLYMKASLRFAAKYSWGIFTISQNTANDVIRLLRVSSEKVLTIYGGVDTQTFAPVQDTNMLKKVKQRYNLQTPYIFYPTSISPRKNIARVLDAFEQIQNDIPHHLYFTGKLAWNASSVEKRLGGPISKRVHRLGSIPLSDMPAIYTLADFTIYPSLFEGLGLPILESFLCEKAVLTSDQTSLPEIAGDAALIVPAYDTKAIAEAMLRLSKDVKLRDELIEKGKQQAKKFTWEITARKALDWIEKHFPEK